MPVLLSPLCPKLLQPLRMFCDQPSQQRFVRWVIEKHIAADVVRVAIAAAVVMQRLRNAAPAADRIVGFHACSFVDVPEICFGNMVSFAVIHGPRHAPVQPDQASHATSTQSTEPRIARGYLVANSESRTCPCEGPRTSPARLRSGLGSWRVLHHALVAHNATFDYIPTARLGHCRPFSSSASLNAERFLMPSAASAAPDRHFERDVFHSRTPFSAASTAALIAASCVGPSPWQYVPLAQTRTVAHHSLNSCPHSMYRHLASSAPTWACSCSGVISHPPLPRRTRR